MKTNNTTKEIKMAYPGIYKSEEGPIYLYLDKLNFYSFDSKKWLEDDDKDNHKTDTNITADYLRNTCGKVESKEHAEFIVNLAESTGFKLIRAGVSMSSVNSFMIYGDDKAIGVYAMKVEHLSNDAGYKLITLPLPPKEENMSNLDLIPNKLDSKHENWDNYYVSKGSWLWQRMEQLNSRTGCMSYDTPEKGIIIDVWNQLNADSESKESKEWPQVDDEVLIDCSEHSPLLGSFNGQRCKVIGICEYQGEKILTFNHSSLGVKALIMGRWIKKPPTPEEELARELIEKYKHLSKTEQAYAIASDIINNEISKLMQKPE